MRGFAHWGVIKFLDEMGVQIDRLSGTSSGAVAAAFIARGYTPDECKHVFIKEKLFRKLRGTLRPGIFKMDGFTPFLQAHFQKDSFDSLSKKLTVSATDIVSGKTIYFTEGELIRPLMGACSIPVLFKPVEYRKYLLLDGGLLNNLPVEPLLEYKLPIIGVHVNPVAIDTNFSNTLKVMERSFNLAIYTNVEERKRHCDLVIEPPALNKFSVHQYSKAEEIFLIGYEYGKSIAKQIEMLMNN